MTDVVVYRCPTHGLIESPTWHEDEIQEDSGWYCSINLTGKDGALHDGITDEVCGKDVSGPLTVEVPRHPERRRSWLDRLTPPTFYKRLWQAEARDGRAARAEVRKMACLALDLLDALGVDDDPSPRVRGAARKLRFAATKNTQDVVR